MDSRFDVPFAKHFRLLSKFGGLDVDAISSQISVYPNLSQLYEWVDEFISMGVAFRWIHAGCRCLTGYMQAVMSRG